MNSQEVMVRRDAEVQAVEGANSEIVLLKNELIKRTQECTTLRIHLETKSIEMLEVSNKIAQLEQEKLSYMTWMERSAPQTSEQLQENSDAIKRNIARLREEERSLRDTIGNSMFLQEQIEYLTKRSDTAELELHHTKLKVASLEKSLKEWRSAAQSHGIQNACALSSVLTSAFHYDATSNTSVAEASSLAQARIAHLNTEVATLRSERDKAVGKAEDMEKLRKQQEELLKDQEKRLSLHDHDRHRSNLLLDIYHSELKTAIKFKGGNPAALMSLRVAETEKLLREFRDVVATYNKPDDTPPEAEIMRIEAENLRIEAENRWREEIIDLQREVDVTRAQRDALREQLDLVTVLFVAECNQPVDGLTHEAQQKIQADLEAAKEEIKKLKIELRDAGASSSNNAELQQLQHEIYNDKKTIERLRKEAAESLEDFQAVCLSLVGYRIEKIGYRRYKVISQYADSEEEYLMFSVDDCDMATMVQTEYSVSLGGMADVHLEDPRHRSIPLLLATLTMELFTRRTVQQVH